MLKTVKRIMTLMILIAATLTVFMAVPDMAKEIDISDTAIRKLEDRLADIEKEQKSLKTTIEKTKKDIVDEKAYKANLDKQIQLTNEDIEVTNQLIIEYQNKIRDTQAEIEQLEMDVSERYELFKKRLVLSYEEGHINYLEMILDSGSFSEFVINMENVACLLDYEQEQIKKLNKKSLDLSELKLSQEDDKNKADKLAKELVIKEANLAKEYKDTEKYINNLIYKQQTDEETIRKNELAMEEIDKEIEEILIERQRQKNAAYVGGDMRWPLDAKWNRISSGYGYRDFDRSVHRGLDIPADYGTTVYAANSGTVVTATYHPSYGYYVLIDHGGDLATLYAHNSSLLVAAGDKVTIGDEISKVGNTGNSYGNHLHFEVRVKGATVDPLAKPYVVVPEN